MIICCNQLNYQKCSNVYNSKINFVFFALVVICTRALCFYPCELYDIKPNIKYENSMDLHQYYIQCQLKPVKLLCG